MSRHIHVGPPRQPTKREIAVLRFVARHTKRKGYPPTHREICGEFGFSSTNAVADHLRSLRRKGLLGTNDCAKSRALSLTPASKDYLLSDETEREPDIDTVAEMRCSRCNAATFAPHPRWLCVVLNRVTRIGDASFQHESPLHAGGSK